VIRNLDFRNYKGLHHVSIDLERLTVLVGPNASGKTSILQGLRYLADFGRHRFPDVLHDVPNPKPLYSRGATEPMALSMEGDEWGLRVRFLDPDHQNGNEITSYVTRLGNILWDVEASAWDSVDKGQWKRLDQAAIEQSDFPRATFLRMEVDRLAAASYSDERLPTIAENGTNLASVLAIIALNQPETFRTIRDFMKSIIPSVNNIRFAKEEVAYEFQESYEQPDHSWAFRRVRRNILGDSIVLDFEGAPSIPGSMASEGTMLVLGLITVLMSPYCPRLILIDDLDRGIHPKAQRDVVQLLRSFLEKNPDAQIVATSHSPYLLDNLKPEEVRLTTLAPDGSVVCARLDEHPDFEQWKDAMTPGEFWSMVGEKWIAESRAAESV
jgi:predicted ATPase